MRIGLLRHFRVAEGFPTGWATAVELQAWRERYDASPVVPGPSDLGGVTWQACLSSDLPRAQFTAQRVYAGVVECWPLLREAQFATFNTGSLRLPIWGWHLLLRLAWSTGHSSQRSCRDDYRTRIIQVVDRLATQPHDTLVVSHAGLMQGLSAELRRRGFAGPKLGIATHATAYVYECQALSQSGETRIRSKGSAR